MWESSVSNVILQQIKVAVWKFASTAHVYCLCRAHTAKSEKSYCIYHRQVGGNGHSQFPLAFQLKKHLRPAQRRCCSTLVLPRLFVVLSLYNSMAVSVWTPPPTERQTLLFAHGSRGLWLTISKPVWVNIWYIPWTNYLSECTLGLLSNPRPFPSGSQAGRHPLGSSACSHYGETFPKAFPVLLASRHALTSFPSCVFHKHTRGPKSSKGRRGPFVNMLDWGWGRQESLGSWHRYAPSCLCNLQWLFDCLPWRTQELLNAVKRAARFKQGYLNLNPVTGRWRCHHRVSLPLFLLRSASLRRFLGSRLNRTHMLRQRNICCGQWLWANCFISTRWPVASRWLSGQENGPFAITCGRVGPSFWKMCGCILHQITLSDT